MFEPARRLLVSIGLAAATIVAPIAGPAQAQIPYLQTINQPKYASIVVDAKSGEVLYAKRADSPRYPASITKVMTIYLAFEAMAAGRVKGSDMITVSPRAAAQPPTKLGLRAGDRISLDDALRSMATKSANDMAVAVAEHLGGSEQRFATMMTLRAKELGMQNTRFVNASGLPDSRQISTARDLAILSRATMRDYPQYYRLFSTDNFQYRGQSLRNHNGLLRSMAGVDGIKTGFTNASGYNIAVSAVRDNRRLITVVLGAPSTASRNNNAQGLMLTGFDVLARRARGERITVAQNLFEPEPRGSLTPSIAQGDEDSEGQRIRLASAESRRSSKIEVVEPEDTPLRKARKGETATSKKGRWIVQVGAFKKKADAKEQIQLVEKRFKKQFAAAEPLSADKENGKYRARFGGFSEGDAKDACKALKAKKLACMVVSPA
jgi:D-alanyl-D-alanine carboxypeptidase